ncbi:MAG: FtsX-like permease family protein [Candidatus Dadabacteria bacterium]|nr:MAG: FtsX-like permease family protein [Candidatus Dadabacteria bacterium]
MAWLELLLRFAADGLAAQKGRSALTMLGIAIGTASVVAVVSIGLVGRAYVIRQIEGVGANLVFAYGTGDGLNPQELTFEDARALATSVRGVVAVAPVLNDSQTVSLRGRPRVITVLGAPPSYARVRNLIIERGRFLTQAEEERAAKVAVVSRELAEELLPGGRLEDAWIRLYDVRFRVVGVFREAVESAAAVHKSEAAGLTAIVPFSTERNLSGLQWVDVVYFQAASAEQVPGVVRSIRRVLAQRHERIDSFKVESLERYLALVRRISDAITLGLVVIAAVSLLVGGIGIMNIMFVTVAERTREIGIRMAIGARRRDILAQFLLEAAILAAGGGAAGIALGVGLPWYVGMLYGVEVPVSAASVVVAAGVSMAVGVFFGFYPARRASQLNLVEALRVE